MHRTLTTVTWLVSCAWVKSSSPAAEDAHGLQQRRHHPAAPSLEAAEHRDRVTVALRRQVGPDRECPRRSPSG